MLLKGASLNCLHSSPLFSEGEAEDVVGNFCRESGSSDGWRQGGAGGHHQLDHRLDQNYSHRHKKQDDHLISFDYTSAVAMSLRSIFWTSPRR